MTRLEAVPAFSGSTSLAEFRAAYDCAQCVCFQQVNNDKTKKRKREESSANSFLRAIQATFHSATSQDQASWCIENRGPEEEAASDGLSDPSEFLSPSCTLQGYCSLIIQDDSNRAVSNFTQQVAPHATLPLTTSDDDASSEGNTIFTTDPYWLFVGRNTSPTSALKGRSEHTDNIQHDGTFHYQCSGSKTWNLRPTEELIERCDHLDMALKPRYTLVVQEGDILVINTRLWWHQTEIPPPVARNGGMNVSISYARDIYLDGKQPAAETMSNQEGAWAVGFLEEGTVLLTEDSNPPMRRTRDRDEANCKLVRLEEEEEESQWAVVTLKDVQEAEFFVLLEQSGDDDQSVTDDDD